MTSVLLIVAMLATVFTLVASGPTAQAQGAAPVVTPNLIDGQSYLGPEVVLSGQARSTTGISAVTALIQNVTSGTYVVDYAGTTSASAIPVEAFTALLPPPGPAGVSFRVPTQLPNGTYKIEISATSATGSVTTLAPLTVEVVDVAVPPLELIAADAIWSYYDDGDLPAVDWFDPAYDSSAWATGPAELGYGDGDEATETNNRIRGNQSVITQYFRHDFTPGDISAYSALTLDLLRDDGAIVYLNGAELGRTNMPPVGTPVDASTFALTTSEQTIAIDIDPALLVAGTNLLAVEVHQVSASSSDLSFRAALSATAGSAPKASDAREGTYVLTAGDMARCNFDGDEAVAAQMADLWNTDAGVFIGLGDLVYNSGTIDEFTQCYDPTIGQFKDVTWPNAGNHEHYTAPNAAGYRQYFGAAAGPTAGPDGGLWYSFDIDDYWHVIALDSDCRGREVLPGAINGDGCAVGSDQEIWLRADLEANQDKNILAFFHHPPFTNNHYTSAQHAHTLPLWRALSEYGTDITLHGHEHHYERLAAIDYWGERDPAHGAREFIIGSGGTYPRYDVRSPLPESDFKGTFPSGENDFGVLQLWLRPDGYDYKWEPINGKAATDEGSSGLSTPMPLAPITGVITEDGTGDPLANVEVCAEAQRTSVETCAISAADGTYEIGPLVTDTYDVLAVRGASQLTEIGTLAAPTPLTVDFAFPTGGSILGLVTDARDGSPISVATVCATLLTTGAQQCANTDSSGQYSIGPLAPGSYLVDFKSTGYFTECWQNRRSCISPMTIVISNSDELDVDATMDPQPGGISGTVTADEDGSALAGIEVCAQLMTDQSVRECTVSATDGTYTVGNLFTGNYAVSFFDPDLDRITQCYLNRSGCFGATPVGLVNPAVRTGIDAAPVLEAVTPTPTATGTPSPTATGTPSPTATGTPSPTATGTPSPTATGTPSPTPTVTPTASPTVTPTPTMTTTGVPTQTPTTTATPIPGTNSISGRITDEATGNAVFGVQVCAVRSFPAAQFCGTSDFSGNYTIPSLTPGNYVVIMTDLTQRYVDGCWGSQPCSSPQIRGIGFNEVLTGFDLQMVSRLAQPTPTPTTAAPPTGTISGTVSAAGGPASAVQVCAYPLFGSATVQCATTDGSGNYTITDLLTSNYRVEFGGGVSCYFNRDGCSSWVPVGLVGGFARTGIDGSI